MNVREVYQHFNTPPNLQEHMNRVTVIVMFIRDNCKGQEINWNNLIVAALLHDLGNIVRFNFDQNTNIYGAEANRLDYWKAKKQEMIEKYGADDHEATQNMLREINADPAVVENILSKSFANSEEIAKSDNWVNKILLYADMRVLPDRIGTLKQRLDELKSRRADLANDPSFIAKISALEQLEKQIQENLSVPVTSITNDLMERYKVDLDDYDL